MKKLITLFAAAVMAVGANAQETGTPIELGGGWNAGFAGDADVYEYVVNNQWGAAEFACNVSSADYPKFILEFEEPLSSNFQINYLWKASADAEGDVTPQYGVAVGDGEKTKFELTFNPEHPYITGVAVQHTDAVTATLKIKKLTLVAASGDNKLIAPSFTSWAGTDNTIMYKGTVSFNDQYQQLVLKGVKGMKDLQIKVELAEDATNVQMCVDYEDGTSEWPQFTGKVATLTTKPGAVIKNCGIQFTAKDASASVEVVGAWIISDPTGVEKVEVLNAANAEFVNAAGQKVGKNYKGLVINKATGKKFINK